MKIVPVLLIKNEEVWIKRVVSALTTVFENVIVTDTGSTDTTISQLRGMDRVLLWEVGTQTAQGLTAHRQSMSDDAKKIFGATHIFLVDGDELYPTSYLRAIAGLPMPDNALSGFTTGIEVGQAENDELWFYGINGNDVTLNRQSIIPVTSHWSGVYPFESPDSYKPGSPLNHYFPVPPNTYGFYHLHHTTRSTADEDVYLRSQKRHQFSLRNVPEIVMHKFWLHSEKEYRDE